MPASLSATLAHRVHPRVGEVVASGRKSLVTRHNRELSLSHSRSMLPHWQLHPDTERLADNHEKRKQASKSSCIICFERHSRHSLQALRCYLKALKIGFLSDDFPQDDIPAENYGFGAAQLPEPRKEHS